MDLGNMRNQEQNNINVAIAEYTAGPLNVNRSTKQAKSIMGIDIVLGENDFEALDMLVTREGEYLSFQQLYEASWSKSKTTDNIDYAFSAMNSLIIQINNVGDDFMWIENKPGLGYTFKTRWGQEWSEERTVYDPKKILAFSITPVKPETKKVTGTLKTTVFTGIGALAIGIVLTLVVLYSTGIISPTADNPSHIEIEDPNTPLGLPGFDIDEESDENLEG